jgi:hypothetical protein
MAGPFLRCVHPAQGSDGTEAALAASGPQDTGDVHLAEELGTANVLKVLVVVERHADQERLKEPHISMPVGGRRAEAPRRCASRDQVEEWLTRDALEGVVVLAQLVEREACSFFVRSRRLASIFPRGRFPSSVVHPGVAAANPPHLKEKPTVFTSIRDPRAAESDDPSERLRFVAGWFRVLGFIIVGLWVIGGLAITLEMMSSGELDAPLAVIVGISSAALGVLLTALLYFWFAAIASGVAVLVDRTDAQRL